MLGDTLTVTLGGSGGTAVVNSKINQDGYSSEYLKKGTDYEVRARIRHSKEKARGSLPELERHNVEFTQTVYATDTEPQRFRQAYLVIRCEPDDVVADVSNLAEALAYWASEANLLKVIGWES
ncbi:MAG: putative coat protein [Boaesivirus pseudofaecivicinum]|uniref:Coat protein n=1 Tax=Leviviridae sp. TaxID=2027243 RepID=A0ABY3STR4_9VIRU|nr:MAG: putative coat protein [Leviviridae sp.]